MRFPKIKVGDVLLVTDLQRRREPRPATVVKVARKYGYAQVGGLARLTRFDLETGYEARADGYNASVRFATQEMLDDEARRRDLMDELRSLGIDLRTGRIISTGALQKIVDIILSERSDG